MQQRISKLQKLFGKSSCWIQNQTVDMDSCAKFIYLGFFIRLGIIIYGEWHDKNLHVPFTDIDYKVFTDAARHVAEGESPYRRHTYRYPPILAWLLVPNVTFPSWGKILFSALDVFSSILIKSLVIAQGFSDSVGLKCAMVWVFNPLAIVISTRGNSDSIISITVLLSAYFLIKHKPFWAGLFLALSVHIRLYPVIFSLPMYLALKSDGEAKISPLGKIFCSLKKLYPNKDQIVLTLTCVTSLCLLTSCCYYLYGMEFLQESLLYHLTRKDTRHNFSVYFYLLYLDPNQTSFLLFLPQLVLLLTLALTYGRKSSLLFCLFAQTFVAVSYNPVLTSQYFVWYLSLLTPNLPRFNLTLFEAGKLTAFWLFSQLAWLVPAYLLEFRGRNTFLYIWFQGIGFFCANIAVLVRLIKRYQAEGVINKTIKKEK